LLFLSKYFILLYSKHTQKTESKKQYIINSAQISLSLSVNQAQRIIQRDLEKATDYINSTWLVAKFPDEVAMLGYEFDLAHSHFQDYVDEEQTLQIRKLISDKINRIADYIKRIEDEKD
jgi:ribosomal protein S15P/S13E